MDKLTEEIGAAAAAAADGRRQKEVSTMSDGGDGLGANERKS